MSNFFPFPEILIIEKHLKVSFIMKFIMNMLLISKINDVLFVALGVNTFP